MKKLGILFLLISLTTVAFGQFNMSNGTVFTCSGVFYDSGGAGGTYGTNQTLTYTICPDNPGDQIELTFTSFDVEDGWDFLTIYNGDNTGAPSLGVYSGATTPGPIVLGNNPTGCLTFVFESDGSVNYNGWAATINCLPPCQTVISSVAEASPIEVCLNEVFTLNGAGIYPDPQNYSQSDGTSLFEWDMGDGATFTGTSVNYSYAIPGIYDVDLNITDVNGCESTNDVNVLVYVSGEPNFAGTEPTLPEICLGDQNTITGNVTTPEIFLQCTAPVGQTTYLPDGNGQSYTSQTVVDCFDAGQTLTNGSDITSICIDMEHSYAGDLVVELECPNGQTMLIFDGSGGGILGEPVATGLPVDDNTSNPNPGNGFVYCFDPTSTNGLLMSNGVVLPTYTDPEGNVSTSVTQYPAGTYEIDGNWGDLSGCPLNGDWTLIVTDLLSADNGYIFEWSIDFPASLVPAAGSYTPSISSEGFQADPTIIATGGNVITVEPTTSGINCYTYEMTDEFGCTFDTTVCFNVLPASDPACNVCTPPTLNIDQPAAVCVPASVDLALTVNGSSDPGTLTYHSTLADADAGINPISNVVTVSGTYYVRLEDPIDPNCYTVVAVNVVINPLPVVTATNSGPICADATSFTLDETGGEATSWSWTSDGSATITNSGDQAPTVTGAVDGETFTVTGTDVNGCVNTAQTTITFIPLPTVSTAGTDPTTCNGTDGFVTVTGSSANAVTISWSGTATGSQAGTTLPYSITGLGAGTYDVSYVDDVTGCATTVSQTVLNNPGAPVLDPVNDTTVCDQFDLEAISGTALTGNETYWSGPGATGTQYSVGDPITTSMTMYAYDINGTCSDEELFTITVNVTPILDQPNDTTVCDLYSLETITGTSLTGNQAYYNNWPSSGISQLTGSITASQTVYVYDADGTCADSTSFIVTVDTTPLLTVADPTAVCEPNLIDITSSATTDVGMITFYTDAALTTPVSNPTQVTAGQYFVEAVNNGCSSSNTINVIINPVPLAPTAGVDSIYCASWVIESMAASGTGGTMTWYDAQNNVLGTGNNYTPDMNIGVTEYFVTETLNGCEGPASIVTITIQACDIIIPTAITPNGDLNNDTWEIVDLDITYPNNSVRVFNRWGNLVFEHNSKDGSPYNDNQWDGTYEGDVLPVGSYYYVIEFNDPEEGVATGAVSIIME